MSHSPGPRICALPTLLSGWIAVLAFAQGSPLLAQLPRPRLQAVEPMAFSLGTTNLLTVVGTELEEAVTLRFTDARVVATPVPGSPQRFSVVVPTNAPVGLQDVRWVGRWGVSNPRRIWFGDGLERSQAATNLDSTSAAWLGPEAALHGRIEAGKRAWFRLRPPAGLAVEIQALGRDLDSRLEPDLTLFEAGGREVARNHRGGRLEVGQPPAGDLLLSLNDLRFRGGEGYGYRLAVIARTNGTPVAFGPPVAGGNRSLASATQRDEIAAATVHAVPTNGFLAVHLPAEASGLFPRRGEVTGLTFEAAKGEVWWLELTSDRAGNPVDPLVLVERLLPNTAVGAPPRYVDVLELAKLDTNIGGNEYPTGSRDVAGRLEVPESGTYRVTVRDLFNQRSEAPAYPWRLSVRAESPGFVLVAVPAAHLKQKDDDRQIVAAATNLRRGETAGIRILATRLDGFNGDIELTATGLPPGLTAQPSRILSGQRVGWMWLTAATHAPAGVSAVTVTGRGLAGTREVTAVARGGTDVWSVADWDQERSPARLTDELVVGVIETESAPISVRLATNTVEWAVVQGGKLSLPLVVDRRGEFTAAFNLKPFGRPELDKAKDLAIPEKATNATVELNLADYALPVGTHLLWLDGRAPGKYRNQPEAVDLAKAELKSAEEALAKAKPEEKTALEAKKKEAAERVKSVEERAKPRDVFVGVTTPPFAVRVLAAPSTNNAVH